MTWTETVSGRKIDFLNPDPKQIVISDIEHAIFRIHRFTGHLDAFWTVGQHCVLVTQILSRMLNIGETDPVPWAEAKTILSQGLFHDAAEAYCADVNTPLKRLLPAYGPIEDRIANAIGLRLGLELVDLPKEVKRADFLALIIERDAFRKTPHLEWECDKNPTDLTAYADIIFALNAYATMDASVQAAEVLRKDSIHKIAFRKFCEILEIHEHEVIQS